jgi:hypothetical protein
MPPADNFNVPRRNGILFSSIILRETRMTGDARNLSFCPQITHVLWNARAPNWKVEDGIFLGATDSWCRPSVQALPEFYNLYLVSNA